MSGVVKQNYFLIIMQNGERRARRGALDSDSVEEFIQVLVTSSK